MAALTPADITIMDPIYNKAPSGYEYSLPRNILESYLSGNAFDYKKEYTTAELEKLKADINAHYQAVMAANPVKEKLATITAGAPGAGKTTLMEKDLTLKAAGATGKKYAYVDPDEVSLKKQAKTYQAELGALGPKGAYDKWRPASNAFCHLMAANLIRENYAFYFGMTATAPQTAFFFKHLKERGYTIRLLHVSAPDTVRDASIQAGSRSFLHTTAEDVAEKGKLFPQRIQDTYLKFADSIEFYFREQQNKAAELAATWVRVGTTAMGILQVHNQGQYAKLTALHDAQARALSRDDLLWANTVDKASQKDDAKTAEAAKVDPKKDDVKTDDGKSKK